MSRTGKQMPGAAKQKSGTDYPPEWSKLNVALSHDWLTGMRGGERVLEILCDAFPRAPVLTLLHKPEVISSTINDHPVRTSWIQRIPGADLRYRSMLPLFPLAVRSLRAPPCDLLISTSHCIAKSVRAPAGARHLCYCFTPMRYAWCFYREYFGNSPLKGLLARPLLAALRRWDRATAQRVDRFVAISDHIRERIQSSYGRDADVVYPPVDTGRWTPGSGTARGDYDLVVSALVPYKRVDLAVRAYSRSGERLLVAGIGGEADRLRALAAPNVEFLGWQPDEKVLELYRNCRMLIFPGEEDFGLVPLEVQACGRPVVALARGGTLETVREGVSGVFFRDQTEEALLAAVRQCASTAWDSRTIRANAERFGVGAFVQGLAQSIAACRRPG
jgi:glycosyltransferase involved in cell wall biosynthesis